MKISSYQPQNSILRQYIAQIYFLSQEAEDEPYTYLAFPGMGYFVNINIAAHVTRIGAYTCYRHCTECHSLAELIYNFSEPHLLRYEGRIREITICFRPLGINAFLARPLGDYVKAEATPFDPFPDYQEHLGQLLSMENTNDMAKALENYWLGKHRGFEHIFLPQVVADLEQQDSPTINGLAENYGISRSTLHEQFERHLCTSPARFKKVVRFRKAMQQHALNPRGENLTGISYIVSYFDQAHMIKDFRALTGYSPKTFFSKLSRLEGGKLNWMIQ